MPIATSPPPPRRRSGLTIVEVLVALVLVSVGLLGMAGTTTLSLRTVGAIGRERRALGLLDLRLAALAAQGCARAVSGSAVDPKGGLREHWAVGPVLRGSALVDLTVDWREGGRARAITHGSAILC